MISGKKKRTKIGPYFFKKSARRALAWGHTSNAVAAIATTLANLSYPYGLIAKRFVVVEPWALYSRSHVFEWLADHSTDTPPEQSLQRPRVLYAETS